jgi:uncharacterized secreted protein with C-terminal beta-propeller domain
MGRILPALGASAALLITTGAPATADAARTRPSLRAFSSCDQLARFARAGVRRAGADGVPVRAVPVLAPPIVAPRPAQPVAPGSPQPVMAASADAGAAGSGFSPTNTQEPGIDEPDVVKTDGHWIYAVADGTLRIVDVSGDAPRLVASLALAGADQQLMLRGSRLLVIARQGGYGIVTAQPAQVASPPPGTIAPAPVRAQETVITELDVHDRAAPVVARTMTVPGWFVDARQHGGTARLVVDATPRLDGSGPVLASTVLRSSISHRTFRRRLAACTAVRRPRAYAGDDVLAILTVDLDRGLYSLDRDGVLAGAQAVYGSPGSLYVATQRFEPQAADGGPAPSSIRTEIHRFDVSDPDRTTYVASGSVPGFVIGPYALSEHEGDLRVATTRQPPWQPGQAAAATHSAITVLRQRGASLSQVGEVDGLGTNQRIYGVRFLGDRAFVVTFRQVDPLYAVDLSDPRAPKVRGELELPGYSSYLHPVGSDLLLGLGRDGGATQLSLFDVSDLAHPHRLSHVAWPQSVSTAEDDPHAFLFWPATNLAVLPLEGYGDPGFDGAVGVRVSRTAGLAEAGRITHADPARQGWDAPVARALVAGGRVFTLSGLGLGANSLDDLAPIGFTPFPVPPA